MVDERTIFQIMTWNEGAVIGVKRGDEISESQGVLCIGLLAVESSKLALLT
jgi:hypothetical protein